jgi:hypothetical protein
VVLKIIKHILFLYKQEELIMFISVIKNGSTNSGSDLFTLNSYNIISKEKKVGFY